MDSYLILQLATYCAIGPAWWMSHKHIGVRNPGAIEQLVVDFFLSLSSNSQAPITRLRDSLLNIDIGDASVHEYFAGTSDCAVELSYELTPEEGPLCPHHPLHTVRHVLKTGRTIYQNRECESTHISDAVRLSLVTDTEHVRACYELLEDDTVCVARYTPRLLFISLSNLIVVAVNETNPPYVLEQDMVLLDTTYHLIGVVKNIRRRRLTIFRTDVTSSAWLSFDGSQSGMGTTGRRRVSQTVSPSGQGVIQAWYAREVTTIISPAQRVNNDYPGPLVCLNLDRDLNLRA